MANRPEGQQGSGQRCTCPKIIGGRDPDCPVHPFEIDVLQPQPTEALPDALLTPEAVKTSWGRTANWDTFTESLNRLLAPLVSARVAAALREAIQTIRHGDVAYSKPLTRHEEGVVAYTRDTLANDILDHLIPAPATAALDKLLAERERVCAKAICIWCAGTSDFHDCNTMPQRWDKPDYISNLGEVTSGEWVHLGGTPKYCAASAIYELRAALAEQGTPSNTPAKAPSEPVDERSQGGKG